MEEKRNFKHDRLRCAELTKEIRKMCRKAKEEYHESLCKEVEELDKKHNPRAYNMIKKLTKKRISSNNNIKDKDGNTLTTEQDILLRWAEYVEDLYNYKDRPLKITPEVLQYMTVQIDSEEVKSIIASLPKKKATGADAIPAELLQYMGNDGINPMTKIINNYYNTGELPEDFLSTTFITIPKVSGTQNCNEHRTISLISHASIENRLGDSQLGFRKGRGTRDGICQLRFMSERLIEKNKKLFVCYVDYKKAFDKIKHVALSKMLAEYNVPNEEIRLISSIYDYQEAQIRINTSLSRKVKIKQGVRQGCI